MSVLDICTSILSVLTVYQNRISILDICTVTLQLLTVELLSKLIFELVSVQLLVEPAPFAELFLA